MDLIPEDAVGLYTDRPNEPLKFLENISSSFYQFQIVEQSATEMILRQQETQHGGTLNYLGAICSSDGNLIYWINNLIV